MSFARLQTMYYEQTFARFAICPAGVFLLVALPGVAFGIGADQRPDERPMEIRAASGANAHVEVLKREGIFPSRDSIGRYFQRHKQQLVEAERLISELGDENFAVRRRASQALHEMRSAPRALLQQATGDEDPEVRWRAGAILRATGDRPALDTFPSRQVCKAIVWTVGKHHVTDCRDVLLDVVQQYREFEMLHLVAQTVAATATEDGAEAWKAALGVGPAWQRAVLLPAATRVDREIAARAARAILEEQQPYPVQLLVALSLLNDGRQDALPVLVACLNPEAPPQVRNYALQVLRKATGQAQLPSDPKQWSQWLAAQGNGIKLKVPVTLTLDSLETFLTRVRLYSAGFGKGNSCTIALDGQVLIGAKGRILDRRGLNVLAMHGDEIVLLGSYDVFETDQASDEFARDIDGLPEGCIVVVVAGDEASQSWNANGQKALESIGAKSKLQGKYRHAYYCIGSKGLAAGKAVERLDPSQGPIYYPTSFEGKIDIHRNQPEEYRKEPRIRIKRGVRREVPW